ncbi:MAG: hypothetical protein ACRD4Q_12070 [Candidatus Acidiferrales bacterium]
MERNKALRLINDLYGLESGYVQDAIEKLGPAALSDRAIAWIASKQLDEERRKGLWLQRVSAYQEKHPHLGWKTCEEYIEMGLQ